jgi:hypothetical protein
VPQLPESFSGFTQLPLHGRNPAAQTHAPRRQLSPVAHAAPHAPQFSGSLSMFEQPPLQTVSRRLQPPSHVPWLQILPEPQTFPHAPQLFGSSDSSWQPSVQNVSAGGHAHAPDEQS